MPWLYLALAIVAEVAGTLELRAFAGNDSRWLSLVLVTVAYVVSFALMALALRHIGVGAVYAIWSGVGTAAVAILGQVFFGERINVAGIVGMALIVGGVMLLVASGSAQHGSARTAPTNQSTAPL